MLTEILGKGRRRSDKAVFRSPELIVFRRFSRPVNQNYACLIAILVDRRLWFSSRPGSRIWPIGRGDRPMRNSEAILPNDDPNLAKCTKTGLPTILSTSGGRGCTLRLRISQPVFARYLNTNESTIVKWETGAKQPSGMALKLLAVVEILWVKTRNQFHFMGSSNFILSC